MYKFYSEINRVGAKINRVIPVLALALTGLFFLYYLLQDTFLRRQASMSEGANVAVASFTDLLLLHQRARDFMLSSRFAEAEMQLDAILKLDSTSFVAYNNLGNAFLLQGRLELAKENYFKALSVAETLDESLGVHFNLAAILFTAGAAALAKDVRTYAGAITAVTNLQGKDLHPHELYFPEPRAILAENVEPAENFAVNDRSNNNNGSNKNKGSGSQKDKGQKDKGQKDKGKKDNTRPGGRKAQADPQRKWLSSYQWDIESSRKPAVQSPGTTLRSVPPSSPVGVTDAANRSAVNPVPAVDAERVMQAPGSMIVVPPIMVATDIANRLARYHGFVGDYAEAQKYLQKVIALDANNFTAHNNLGNLYFLQGHLDSARTAYSQALPLARTADDSLGIRLNLAALWHAVNADTLAAAQLAEVFRHHRDLSRVERLLGLKFDDIDLGKARAEQLRGVTVFSMKHLVMLASRFAGSRSGAPPPEGSNQPGVLQGKRVAGDIENVFVWAK